MHRPDIRKAASVHCLAGMQTIRLHSANAAHLSFQCPSNGHAVPRKLQPFDGPVPYPSDVEYPHLQSPHHPQYASLRVAGISLSKTARLSRLIENPSLPPSLIQSSSLPNSKQNQAGIYVPPKYFFLTQYKANIPSFPKRPFRHPQLSGIFYTTDIKPACSIYHLTSKSLANFQIHIAGNFIKLPTVFSLDLAIKFKISQISSLLSCLELLGELGHSKGSEVD